MWTDKGGGIGKTA